MVRVTLRGFKIEDLFCNYIRWIYIPGIGSVAFLCCSDKYSLLDSKY